MLLVWLTPIRTSEDEVEGVLCRRHADLTTVPRGWTLDDRRESALRLFRPPAAALRPAAPEVVSGPTEPDADEPDAMGNGDSDVEVTEPVGEAPADDLAVEPVVDHTGEQLRLDDPLLTEADTAAGDVVDVVDGDAANDDTGNDDAGNDDTANDDTGNDDTGDHAHGEDVAAGPDSLDATGALDLTGAMERPDPEIVAAASSELLARAFLGTTRRQPRRRMRP
jgi:hypothetical protein